MAIPAAWPVWLTPLYDSFRVKEGASKQRFVPQVGPSIDRSTAINYSTEQSWTVILKEPRYQDFLTFYEDTHQGAITILGTDPVTKMSKQMRIKKLESITRFTKDIWQVSLTIEVL